jgi:hypothetical protein
LSLRAPTKRKKGDRVGYGVYFSDRVNHQVLRWDPDDGNVRVVAGDPPDGALDQKLRDPYGLAFDPGGYLLVADKLSHRICRVVGGRLESLPLRDVDGHRRKKPDSPASYTPELVTPTSLFMEKGGALLCTFHQDHTIYRIHQDGRLELVLGVLRNKGYYFVEARESVAPPQVAGTPIQAPTSVVARSDGTIFFIERGWEAVREYHPQRGLRSIFPLGLHRHFAHQPAAPAEAAFSEYHPGHPTSLALDAEENLYLTDLQHGCVLKVDFTANQVVRVAESRPRPGVTQRGIEALGFGPDGRAWVLDAGAQSIEGYAVTPQGPWTPLGLSFRDASGRALQSSKGGTGLVIGN